MSLRVKLASVLARWRRRCQDRAVTTRLVGRCPHSGTTGTYVASRKTTQLPEAM
jgi:hypothetical protein